MTLLGRTHGVEEISREENLKHTAVFRLALGRTIPNVQASWVKTRHAGRDRQGGGRVPADGDQPLHVEGGAAGGRGDRIDPERHRREHADDPVEGVVADYEPHGDATIRMIALEERVPAVAPFLARGRAGHRAWVQEAFAAQLPPEGDPGREQAVNLHVVATDIFTWKLLRRDMGLSAPRPSRPCGRWSPRWPPPAPPDHVP